MRIAFFLPSLQGGGAERVMVNLARGFVERRLTVDLVLAKAEGPYLSCVPPEVRVVDLAAPRVLASLPGLVNYLRQQRPQTMLSAMDHANVVAIWGRTLARVPVRLVLTVHSTPSIASRQAGRLKGRVMPFLMRRAYRAAEAVVVVSRGAADDLIRLTGLPQEKVHVIYNPVVTAELFRKAEEPLDHPWFRENEPPVIIGVGRLTAAKDFPTLIQAFAFVRDRSPARLMILGEGEDRPRLEALVKQLGIEADVALPGFMQNPYPYMKRAAVFVLSSIREGLPTVLIEALALGTCVVSTDCPSGPREILEGGKWGRLVSPGNPEELANAILAALESPSREPCARIEPFTLERAAAQYLALLEG